MPKRTPCDTEPFTCPYDAESGEACRVHCGVGVDEDELYEDLLMEQKEQM